jgi:hypothetical protein
VEHWIQEVEPFLRPPNGGGPSGQPPAFPLTSPELRTLEKEIYQAAQETAGRGRHHAARLRGLRAVESSIQGSLERLHETLDKAQHSSYYILYSLVGLGLLNAAYVAVFIFLPDVPHYLLIVVNVAGIGVAILIWYYHDLDLRLHEAAVHFHTAIHPGQHADSSRADSSHP